MRRKGRLRIRLIAACFTEYFVVKAFTKNISYKLSQALDGLVEK